MRCLGSLLLLGGLLVASIAFSAHVRADDAILVLDASGSMWGKVREKDHEQTHQETKVEIARNVVSQLVDDIPADRRLGLVAYGHRRTADCKDIEQVVPVGSDRKKIVKAVKALNFKGKTPLTAAVQFAAEKLHYKTGKATVILVSDGLESCNADPCALAAALEAAGADLTVHVVGFGLGNVQEAAGLKCLAEATGGKYFSADNAEQLKQALEDTVVSQQQKSLPPTQGSVVLRATELAGGAEITAGLHWTLQSSSGATVLDKTDAGVVSAVVPPGNYKVTATRSDGTHGEAKLVAHRGLEHTVTIPFDVTLRATLTLNPSSIGQAGSLVSVQWTGPNREFDHITLVPVGAEMGVFGESAVPTTRGNPLDIKLPTQPGAYEVRYLFARPQRVLAHVPLQVTSAAGKVEAPSQAVVGANFSFTWNGPNNVGDALVLAPVGAEPAYYGGYDARMNINPRTAGKGELRAPTRAGDYEVRYLLSGKTVLASSGPIKVTEGAPVTFSAPASAEAGTALKFSWKGPNNKGDTIVLAPVSESDAFYGHPDQRTSIANNTLQVPREPGSYELRYMLNNKTVVGRGPVTVTAPKPVTIQHPASMAAGVEFDLTWAGPNNNTDALVLAPVSENDSFYGGEKYRIAANAKSRGHFPAPVDTGSYEIRYLLNGKTVLTRSPLTVTASGPASVQAPAHVKANQRFALSWTGPSNPRDMIVVCRASERDDYLGAYYHDLAHFGRGGGSGGKADFTAPKVAGDYELRYVLGGKKILARTPLVVNE